MAFITTLAVIEAKNTVSIEFFIAIMADMKNVLSPNSEQIITANDSMNALLKPESVRTDHNSNDCFNRKNEIIVLKVCSNNWFIENYI